MVVTSTPTPEVHCLIPFSVDDPELSQVLKQEPLTLHLIFYPLSTQPTCPRLLFPIGSLWEGLQSVRNNEKKVKFILIYFCVLLSKKLPPWTNETCTMTYFPDVKLLLKPYYESWAFRKKLIKSLIENLGKYRCLKEKK